MRSLVLPAVLLAGAASCSAADSYTLGQPIEMGPWIFEVAGVQQRLGTRSGGGRQKTVTVRLENYRERHEQPFGDFMNGDAPGRIVIFPNIQLVHPDGAEFYIYLTPASGGELRSERWQGRTELIPHNAPLLADAVELAERYADTQLSDLSLLIENPDRLAGQPRRVVIPLQ